MSGSLKAMALTNHINILSLPCVTIIANSVASSIPTYALAGPVKNLLPLVKDVFSKCGISLFFKSFNNVFMHKEHIVVHAE